MPYNLLTINVYMNTCILLASTYPTRQVQVKYKHKMTQLPSIIQFVLMWISNKMDGNLVILSVYLK